MKLGLISRITKMIIQSHAIRMQASQLKLKKKRQNIGQQRKWIVKMGKKNEEHPKSKTLLCKPTYETHR